MEQKTNFDRYSETVDQVVGGLWALEPMVLAFVIFIIAFGISMLCADGDAKDSLRHGVIAAVVVGVAKWFASPASF
jgi:hypothetical protein